MTPDPPSPQEEEKWKKVLQQTMGEYFYRMYGIPVRRVIRKSALSDNPLPS